jgi:hypothetical protein
MSRKSSRKSSAAVRPYKKAVLATLDKETLKFYKELCKEKSDSEATISDYKLVVKHRPLTESEKRDLDTAIKMQSRKGKLYKGSAIQAGIECGIYAVTSLIA